MPELPEVECIKNDLENLVTRKRIEKVKLLNTGLLRGITSNEFCRRVCGKDIEKIERRGKYLLFFLSGDYLLEIHLRMTGHFLYYQNPVKPDKYSRAVFFFNDGSQLHFQDARRFGTFRIWNKKELQKIKPYLLGPEPLNDEFNFAAFQQILHRKPNSGVKSFLLDQGNIAGMGNIYTDESLFRAGIHPARKIKSLSQEEEKKLFQAIKETLGEGVTFGGTSIVNFRDLSGSKGAFQEMLKVYRREKKPCPHCGEKIARLKVAGRSTYYCPSCQPL